MSYLTESGRRVGVGLIGLTLVLACAVACLGAESNQPTKRHQRGRLFTTEECDFAGAFDLRVPTGYSKRLCHVRHANAAAHGQYLLEIDRGGRPGTGSD